MAKLCYHEPPAAALKAIRRKFRSYWLLQDAWPGRFDRSLSRQIAAENFGDSIGFHILHTSHLFLPMKNRWNRFWKCPTYGEPLLSRKSPWTTTLWYEMIYFFFGAKSQSKLYSWKIPPLKNLSFFSLLKIMLSPFRFEFSFSCCPENILWLPSLKTMHNFWGKSPPNYHTFPTKSTIVTFSGWWKCDLFGAWEGALQLDQKVTTWIIWHVFFLKGNALLKWKRIKFTTDLHCFIPPPQKKWVVYIMTHTVNKSENKPYIHICIVVFLPPPKKTHPSTLTIHRSLDIKFHFHPFSTPTSKKKGVGFPTISRVPISSPPPPLLPPRWWCGPCLSTSSPDFTKAKPPMRGASAALRAKSSGFGGGSKAWRWRPTRPCDDGYITWREKIWGPPC